MEMPYDVLTAERPHRLVLEGTSPTGQPFRQEITLESREGRTVLRIVHSGFHDDADWDEEIEGMDSGWQLALTILRTYLDHHFGRPRTVATAIRPAPLDWSRIRTAFTTRSGLEAWLARTVESDPGEVGDPVVLLLDEELGLRGKLLADSGRELAIHWPQRSGVLELKAFAAGPGGMVGLRVHSWDPQHPAAELQPLLDRAADDLADHVSRGH